jgi:hypothetical protein
MEAKRPMRRQPEDHHFWSLKPLLIRWQCRDRLGLHRLNERRFYALPNWLAIHRLCAMQLSL